ncbi:MAG: aldehyde dehydrogenase family protein [Mobiluncus porci]|uniref:aldehyde dehydrogenase family protein n=1 Tax=Mobiluncus TaxID=2050 RepID=UPI0023F1F826|nr:MULTISPECIES: aldehyde dehydrogenase family protein [Mobiluncus]MCI6583937.1 aldehyde dehydrogenase family protein [Mobiluncus sp.]MDD7542376.1 aldehyde dehydrogenase family protein [Mobiluncus porci]MDY5747685.1 aldehyde dehydrogenase family protein [Mobiluncus porci]
MNLPDGIDQEFLDALFAAASTENGEAVDIYDVQHWEVIGEIRCSTIEDAFNSLSHAKVMSVQWTNSGSYQRSRILYRFLRQVLRHQESILGLSQLLSGKSRVDATEEYLDILSHSLSTKRALKHLMKLRRGSGAVPMSSYRVERKPLGVVGLFSSPDFQLSMVCDLLTAVMAGNTVVNFVTPQAAIGALMMKALLVSAGLPSDVWRIVVSPTVDLGMKLIPGLDYVSIVASTETCRKVAKQCGFYSVPVTFFGTFKNVAVILEDAKLWNAAKGCARAAFQNAGQSISGLEVIFVQERVKEPFEELLAEYTRDQLRLGTYHEKNAAVGSLLRPERAEYSRYIVEQLLTKGGRVLTGSHARPEVSPTFFEPTIVTDLQSTQSLLTTEFYGPVVAIVPFRDVTEVIGHLTKSRIVNSACLFTQDMEFVTNFINNIEVSTVLVNDTYLSLRGSWQATMPVREETGQGIRHGLEAMYQYTRPFSATRLKHISWVPKDLRTGNWTERMTFAVMGINSWMSRHVTDTILIQALKTLWWYLRDRVIGPV